MSDLKPRALAQGLFETASRVPKEQHKKIVQRFISFLLKRGLINSLPRIINELFEYGKQKEGLVEAKIETVEPLEAKQLNEMLVNLGVNPQNAIISQVKKPELIAGFVATVDDTRFDASVAGRLKNIHKALVS